MEIIYSVTKKIEKLAVTIPFLANLCLLYYKKIVQKEIDLGKISPTDKVLCIGGGPLPCTALEIAQLTGATVEVIDNDPDAVECARQVVDKLKLDKKIKIKYADGLTVDASSFTVVHLALQVKHREKVLKNVWQKAPKGARILMRSPKEGLKSFYSPISDLDACGSCNTAEQRYCAQKYCTMEATLLFTKPEERMTNEKANPAFNRTAHNRSTSLAG